jgi:hypothetical protein
MRDDAMHWYARILDRRWFVPIVIGLFVIKVAQIVAVLVFGFVTGSLRFDFRFSVVEWGTYLSGAVSGVVAVIGLWFLVRNLRVKALESFAFSTLVTILFGQFFAFTTNQFAAIGSLLVQLVILGVLRFAIAAEDHANDHMEGTLPAEGRG